MSREAPERVQLLADIQRVVRQVIARGVLFHQAVAAQVGLGATDLQCLAVLQETGAVTAGELATRTGLTTGGITRVVDRLDRAGFVRREPDPRDRRRVRVAAVPERLGEIGGRYESVAAGWAELLAGYDDEQLRLFLELFTRMRRLSDEQITAVRADRIDQARSSESAKRNRSPR
ncbi:MarR family transcriptional regulator [Pseudonocardia asaccharolytica]|uniref:Putative HTH-type transcriptional regulator YcgE n=1 Tax=Pseudonocardia asaccharolytica DSM 44247 = NBRC 16224 TaxID=1123024 RepID=A0A511D625_9PSEU|nr:MarR family transcriptional regulator [Pseudonocardia asaccharolytica]GEL20241.1 putative HTH-type transcriptional regulator YcgE [Pseudonocardia asaccharolytica DSM 44247 = NBRC 16224]